jgi:hypothetical protein
MSKVEGFSLKSPDNVISAAKSKLEMRFTLADKSNSRQGKERAVLFKLDGSSILGIGANHPEVEGAFADDNTGNVTFHRFAGDGKAMLKPGPTNEPLCANCHTRRFVYIWGSYDRKRKAWPGFFGSQHDQQDPDDPAWKKVRENPKWSALFAGKEKAPLFVSRASSIPYQWPLEARDRSLAFMPNSQLSLAIGRRTARRLYSDLKTVNPRGFARYRYLLARLILGCRIDDSESDAIAKDYERLGKEFRI